MIDTPNVTLWIVPIETPNADAEPLPVFASADKLRKARGAWVNAACAFKDDIPGDKFMVKWDEKCN